MLANPHASVANCLQQDQDIYKKRLTADGYPITDGVKHDVSGGCFPRWPPARVHRSRGHKGRLAAGDYPVANGTKRGVCGCKQHAQTLLA